MAKEGVNIWTPVQGVKLVTLATVPEQLMAKGLAQSIEFIAQKAQFTNNTGNIAIGWDSADGGPKRQMIPGEVWALEAPWGTKLDLSLIYIDVATALDGLIYTYQP